MLSQQSLARCCGDESGQTGGRRGCVIYLVEVGIVYNTANHIVKDVTRVGEITEIIG